jgi:hypothetical protein
MIGAARDSVSLMLVLQLGQVIAGSVTSVSPSRSILDRESLRAHNTSKADVAR